MSEEPQAKLPADKLGISLDAFIKHFESLSSPQEKLCLAFGMLRKCVSQKENLPFKEFWEIRKLCMPLFKENISASVRTSLWNEYIELTKEGRELKNRLDEEANFAAEQIEIAINALEKDIETFKNKKSDVFEKKPKLPLAYEIHALKSKAPFYEEKKQILDLLNLFAERINSLRKELIKIQLRFRFKNKFFQKLSDLGDEVFPMRRDLIQEVSLAFEEDIKIFVEANFSEKTFSLDKTKKMVFSFREEIKSLQAIAKMLTLNTEAFSNTRQSLSECWDKLKEVAKDFKKIPKEPKVEISFEEAKQAEEARLNKAKAEEKKRHEVEEFKKELEALKQNLASQSCEILTQEMEMLIKKMALVPLTKKEKAECDRFLKRVAEEIEEKKEEALLTLSDDEKKALENLNEILTQRKERRSDIKKQIDEYRKILGGSSLDISKSMEMNELINAEKERLEKIEEGIIEIQKKIKDLKRVVK